MKNKHVLITGGMGFIGHNLAKLYLKDTFKVTVVDNLTNHHNHASLTKYRMEYVDNENLNFIQLNCSMTHSIKEKLRGKWEPKSIIHLASYPNQAAVKNDRYGAASSMIADTLAVAELAKQLGSKLIFTSSSMAYGNFTRMPMPESETLNPVNLYGMLKAQGEDIAKFVCPNTVIIRPSAVYGPGDNINRVLGLWIQALLNNKDIVVLNPTNLLDFTHVNDLAIGIKQAEEHGVAGEVYNLTKGEARSLAEAAYLCHKTVGGLGLVHFNEEKPMDEPQRGSLDISKAKDHLGFKPKIDLINGIKQYVNWMKNYEHLYRD